MLPRFGFRVFADQLLHLTRANLKSRYRKTFAGFLWVVLNPVIMYGVQAEVFSRYLKLNVDNYALFLLSGLLPWIFFSQSLDMTTSIFVIQGRMLKSYPVHPLVYLGAQIADNLVNFVAAFVIVLVPVWARHPGSAWSFLLLPPAVLALGLATFVISWLLATLHVFFRDTRFIVTFVTGIAFFLTPIFYPPQYVSGPAQALLRFNPAYILIRPFRAALYDHDLAQYSNAICDSFALGAVLAVVAFFVWKRRRNELYFHI